ncbi:MAG: hypothetical protein MJ252_18270 [archaeon]|nr:hypothetical protein [archaeon]
MRKRIKQIRIHKDEFRQTRDFLLHNFFVGLNLSNGICQTTAMNICEAISLFMLYGEDGYWSNSFQDIINYSEQSRDNYIYASMILGRLDDAITGLSLDKKEIFMHENVLKDNKMNVYNYIKGFMMLLTDQNSHPVDYSTFAFKNFVKLLLCYSRYGLPFIQEQNIPLFFIDAINNVSGQLLDDISEIFTNLFKYSNNSSLHKNISLPDNGTPSADYVVSQADQQELNGLSEIMSHLLNAFSPYFGVDYKIIPQQNLDKLFYYANIFSSYCANYPFLLFLNNNISQNMLTLLHHFSCYPVLKISQCFFEIFGEIREMVYKNFVFAGNPKEIINYFTQISTGVMNNLKLSNLNVDVMEVEKNITKVGEQNLANILEDIEIEEETDIDDVPIKNYRKTAAFIFEDIIQIIQHFDPENGVSTYLTELGALIQNKPEPMTEQFLCLVEAVLYNVRCVKIIFDIPGRNPEMLLNFCEYIFSFTNNLTNNNNKIMLSFVIFLNSLDTYIPINESVLLKSFQFLVAIACSYISLQPITAYVIKELIEKMNGALHENIYKLLSDFYVQNFDQFTSITNKHLTAAILNISLNESSNINAIVTVVNSLLGPVNNLIQRIPEFFPQKNIIDDEKKKEILFKISTTHSAIALHFQKFNKFENNFLGSEMLFAICDKNNSNTCCLYSCFNYYDNLVQYFSGYDAIIDDAVLFLLRFTKAIHNKSEFFFADINKILYSVLTENVKVYSAIELMKGLYGGILTYSNNMELRNQIESSIFMVINQLSLRINDLSANSLEQMKNTAAFVAKMIEKMNSFQMVPNDPSNQNFNIFNEFFKKMVNMTHSVCESTFNQRVLKFLDTFYSSNKITNEIKLSVAFEVLTHFFNQFNKYTESDSDKIGNILYLLFNLNPDAFLKFLSEIENGVVFANYFEFYARGPLFKEKSIKFAELLIECSHSPEKKEEAIKKLDFEVSFAKSRINMNH